MRAPDLRRPAVRLSALRALLCVGLLAVAARAAHLTLFDHRGARHGERQVETEIRLPPERGEILDRRGQQLAVTVKAPSIFAVPGALQDPAATAKSLAAVLGADPARVAERLAKGRSFTYVARWVTPQQAEKVRALSLEGVGLVEEPRRVYPYGTFAAHLIGFANIDGTGVRGLEEQEEAFLRGTARTLPVERDARGRRLLSEQVDPFATVGGNVQLTLDAAFQSDAEAALDEAMQTTGSASGMVVSLDPRTGDVLSLAERPLFDPNHFRDVPYKTTRARTLLDANEPGSTFKVFLMAAALDAGAVSLSDHFDCERGRFKVPGKLIRDSHPYGVLDLQHVLWKSSNIGATKIAYRLGPDTHYQMLQQLGFGKPTGSGFPQESSGLLRSSRGWRPVDRANIAFGQGVNVTALQLAAATGAIANGGVWVQPRLVLGRTKPGGQLELAPPAAARRAMKPETAATVLSMMEGVTGPEGTGKRAALPGIRVGGKTGTAQKLDPRTGAYSNSKYQAWFIGVAPVEDPRLVIVVMLDEPKGLAHTGGAVAAPVFARVAAAQLARLGIFTAPSTPAPNVRTAQAAPAPQTALVTGAQSVAAAESAGLVERFGDRILVPDFTDRTVDEVQRQATGILDVVISGEGRAVAQEPAPGTIVDGRETRVSVRFERGPGEG
jgi:cell division protein FtsI (penicillin-binding protein 3)